MTIAASNRRQPRRDVEFGGFAERLDGSEVMLTVTNLSYDGCQLRCNEKFYPGERMKLRLPGRGELRVEIRWFVEGRAGASFVLDE